MKHCAMNLLTFEIIGTNTGNHLKRSLKIHKRYNGAGVWIFSHKGYDGLYQKYEKGKKFNYLYEKTKNKLIK